MSKQQETAVIALSKAVERWDYDSSVKKMRPLVRQWKKATIELVRELFLAKEYLTNQEGQYKDPEADNYLIYSWKSYCEEIELPCQIANNWIKTFTPKEFSDTGKDVLMLESPIKTEKTENLALMEARMEKVLRTGKRPAGWTDKEEKEYRRRKENERFASLALKMNMPAIAATKHDYFADILKHSKDIINFKLADQHQIYAQAAIFDHIDAYLNTFDDPEIKERAAFNLVLKARNRANEIAEMNFQLNESAPEKEEEYGSE